MYTQLFRINNSWLLAESSDDWLNQITYLAEDEVLRAEMAANAKRQSLHMFHPDRMAEQLDSICGESVE